MQKSQRAAAAPHRFSSKAETRLARRSARARASTFTALLRETRHKIFATAPLRTLKAPYATASAPI
jgi:hypothetical protein